MFWEYFWIILWLATGVFFWLAAVLRAAQDRWAEVMLLVTLASVISAGFLATGAIYILGR
jgi:hypothetical protein